MSATDPTKALTAKQLGDAGEHLFIGTLMLAAIPAAKMPDGWKGFDIVAFPPDWASAVEPSGANLERRHAAAAP